MLQRGATNVYFPHTVSSIYLPLWAERADPGIVQALENSRIWETLTAGLDDGKYVQSARCEAIAGILGLNSEELRVAAQRRLDGVAAAPQLVDEEEFRRAEYDAIREGRGGLHTDLLVDVLEGASFHAPLDRLLSRVCLVRKLRETRALAGFSRILPPTGIAASAPGEARATIQRLSATDIGWLPATVVRGEGIFIEFDHLAIDEWVRQKATLARTAGLLDAFARRRLERKQPPRGIGPKFILLHTIAHLMLRRLCFECGYGSASIRERIYCETAPQAQPMQGILIYTASGDSEGTLGGLVRQGEPGRLEAVFEEAMRDAEWCSSDPVCLESTGQGVDNANLAACHGCSLVSETSCEEGNRLLDRGLLVGSLKDPGLGFLRWIASR